MSRKTSVMISFLCTLYVMTHDADESDCRLQNQLHFISRLSNVIFGNMLFDLIGLREPTPPAKINSRLSRPSRGHLDTFRF